MNAGLEDCLTESGGELAADQLYQDTHWSDTRHLRPIFMYNYIEMRSHVNQENALHYYVPVSLYPSLFNGGLHTYPLPPCGGETQRSTDGHQTRAVGPVPCLSGATGLPDLQVFWNGSCTTLPHSSLRLQN